MDKDFELLQAVVTDRMQGERLDKALALLAPNASLRRRRRLWLTHRVLVDGRPRPKGFLVRAGQVLSLAPLDQDNQEGSRSSWNEPYVVKRQADLAALFKPAGLPTAAIAGKPGPSMEACLAGLLGCGALLLNRLDTPTSGLVLAALTPDAEKRYARAQAKGLTRKTYAALVHGLVPGPMVIDRALDTAKRRTSRVLDQPAGPLRETAVTVLHCFTDAGLSLVAAEIRKGARHQIRAHLAHAGHPILGDALYGDDGAGGFLHLHHLRLDMPGFSALSIPQWPLPGRLRADRS